MARSFHLLLMVAVLSVLATESFPAAGGLGMNWGTMATHPLPPGIAVRALQDSSIRKVKLFDADANTMGALAGSGIEVMVTIPNNLLAVVAADYGAARQGPKNLKTQPSPAGPAKVQPKPSTLLLPRPLLSTAARQQANSSVLLLPRGQDSKSPTLISPLLPSVPCGPAPGKLGCSPGEARRRDGPTRRGRAARPHGRRRGHAGGREGDTATRRGREGGAATQVAARPRGRATRGAAGRHPGGRRRAAREAAGGGEQAADRRKDRRSRLGVVHQELDWNGRLDLGFSIIRWLVATGLEAWSLEQE